MVPTCSHPYPSFRVTQEEDTVLLCWHCLMDEIEASKIGQPILVVREID